MSGEVIEVDPARPHEDTAFTGGDDDCDHERVDQASRHAVCRDCGATSVTAINMPDELVADDPFAGTVERL